MMCSHPWVRAPLGVGEASRILSENARLAAMPIPCGQCFNCRINKARVWVHRLLLEQMMHKESCIATFTYDKDHLPEGGTLVPEDMTLFLKRLRSRLDPQRFKYLYVGEYGLEKNRPHYHCALFGVFLSQDKVVADCWGLGAVHFGELNKEYARYISGYVVKGLTHGNGESRYSPEGLHPEFMRCSRRPGIGAAAADMIGGKFAAAGQGMMPVNYMRMGKKKWAVGRYLKERIGKASGVDENIKALQLREYQDEIFEKFKDADIYFDAIVAEDRVRREKVIHNYTSVERRKR